VEIAGRDAILTMKDGMLKFATADGDETFPAPMLPRPISPRYAMRLTIGSAVRGRQSLCTTVRRPYT
jgi:hypothetical protein